jgi:hypothetical protein
MSNRKALPPDLADKFFEGKSMFFGDPPHAPLSQQQPVKEAPVAATPTIETPPPTAQTSTQDSSRADHQPSAQESLPSVRQDVTIDVTTSLLQDVDLKAWREQIEDTETQNSSLRLTSEERYIIEDVVSDLQRKEKVKTSMNEVARLGLLFLIHEFKKHRRKSIIYRVKKA